MQFGILLLNASGNDVAVMQMYMLEAVLMCLPVFLLFSYMFKMQSKQKNKITVLTEAGEDEKEKWKALKNFMSEYSLISEKGMNDLVIWEKYLIFATAFGLSDKVIKEFKAKYKRVIIEEKWNESDIKEKYPLLYFSYGFGYNYINTNSFFNIYVELERFESIYHICNRNSFSSSHNFKWKWLRRRILRWRRRPEAVGGRNGRKIIKSKKIFGKKLEGVNVIR